MASTSRQDRAEAVDVESGRIYEEPKAAPVNQSTVLPTYHNGNAPAQQTSPSGSMSEDHKDNKAGREVDLDATEPPHEEHQAEKSQFTQKLDSYSHMKRPFIHAVMVLFCLGRWLSLLPS